MTDSLEQPLWASRMWLGGVDVANRKSACFASAVAHEVAHDHDRIAIRLEATPSRVS